MAWAIRFNSEFGRTFPNGEFVDWDHRFKLSCRTIPESIKGDVGWNGKKRIVKSEALQLVATNFPAEHGKGLPTRFLGEQVFPWHRLSSLVMLNGVFAVDRTFKRIIEQVEPDVHEFWPLTIRWWGLPHFKRYWGLSVNQFMSSLVPNQCVEGACETTDYKMYRVNTVSAMRSLAGMAFSPKVQDGAHLWIERWVNGADLFLSDTFMAECHKARCSLPDHVQVLTAKDV